MPDDRREFKRRSDRIEELVRRIESTGDPATRAVAQELVQAVIELNGAALDRVLRIIDAMPESELAFAQIVADELVSNVLSLHGLHPVPVETRVADALQKTRPYLKSHGGDVELISLVEGVVHLRLQGACGSCSSSTETLKHAVEDAIFNAAPEVVTVIADPIPVAANSNFVVLQTNQAA